MVVDVRSGSAADAEPEQADLGPCLCGSAVLRRNALAGRLLFYLEGSLMSGMSGSSRP
jgi:hypothetical protein